MRGRASQGLRGSHPGRRPRHCGTRAVTRSLFAACCGFALSSPCAAASDAPRSAGTITHEQIVEMYGDAASRFVELDGVKIHYKDEGRGPAVLLVHGSLGDLADWDGWVAVLRERYRVIRLDLPSFGLSGRVPSGNYSIDRYLTLVDSLMDHLNEARFAIVGTSYGGLVAFRYAAAPIGRVIRQRSSLPVSRRASRPPRC